MKMLSKPPAGGRVSVRSILLDGRGGVIGTVDVEMPTDLAIRIMAGGERK